MMPLGGPGFPGPGIPYGGAPIMPGMIPPHPPIGVPPPFAGARPF